jgi:dihydroflavonol-4-reductase
MRAVVTGANGFIGHHVVRALVREGITVRAMVRPSSQIAHLEGLPIEIVRGDMLRPDTLTPCFDGCDWCFHVAGVFHYGSRDPQALINQACTGVENVIRAARKTGTNRVILTSSSVVLGTAHHKAPIDEKATNVRQDFLPYEASKKQQLDWARRVANQQQIDLRVLGPTLTIGPDDQGPTESNRMILNYLKDPWKSTWLGGCNLVSVADVARAHVLVAERGESGQFYLAGSDNQEWLEVHQMISELCGLPGPYFTAWHTSSYAASLAQEMWGALAGKKPLATREQAKMVGRYYWYDSSRLINLGYQPVSSREALVSTLEWLVRSPHLPGSLRSSLQLSEAIHEKRNHL